MDKKIQHTIKINSIYATVTTFILMLILFMWVNAKMPMYLSGLLFGMFVNIPLVDFRVEYRSRAARWYPITTIIQAAFVVISLVVLIRTYGGDLKWWCPALIIIVLFESYLYKNELKDKLKSINLLTLFSGILSALPLISSKISNNREILFVLGVLTIIISFLAARNNKDK